MLNSSLVYYSTSLWLNFQYKQTSAPEKGERPGLSVFMKEGDAVFHTYSSYGRGLDDLLVTYRLLDLTPLGRNEIKAQMDWKHHDKYDNEELGVH